jgi:uncharacterized damage-inducible protein DinB
LSRSNPPSAAPERESLESFLEYQRSTVALKASGLSDSDGARRLLPSLTTVTGLVRHLTDVERYWFRAVLDGESDVPFRYSDTDPDGDFRITAAASLQSELAEYAIAVEESRRVALKYPLDELAHDSRGQVTLRWVLIHLIEETARHLGHIDILRELLDGTTGD